MTIWSEFNKVRNSQHKKFYSGVIVVCNEVFQNYAACFSHRGLFISSKRKINDSQQRDNKKQKAELENEQVEKDEDEDYSPRFRRFRKLG